MKKFFFVVSFLILFVTNALAITVGEVKDKMGSTFNERAGKTEKVIAGYLLEMHDFLQTGEDGAMNIVFVDNTKVTLAPNTEFLIDEFAFDTTVVPIEIAMNVSINVGTFTYESGDISKMDGDVEIATPTATITVQGTAFSGTVAISGITTITLLPDSSGQVGEVTVSNDAGSQILTQVYTSVTVDKTTAQTLSSKTLTSPVLNGTLSGTAFLDEDTFSSDSAIAVASQQSIKAYIATQVSEGDLTAIVAGTGLSGTDLTGPIPTLTIDTGTTVDKTTAQILTNKSIDSDNNTITNIVNADIKAAAAIDATKIADGSVSDTEFQRLDGLTSDIQTQLDLKAALASPDLTGNPTAPTQSASDNSTKLATTAYVDGQVATENELSELNDVTIAAIADANYLIYDDAAGVWKNKAISGAFTSTKAGVTTLSASIDATKIADGTVTSTEFQYINTLSSNAQDQIDTKASAGFAVAMAIAL